MLCPENKLMEDKNPIRLFKNSQMQGVRAGAADSVPAEAGMGVLGQAD